MREVGTLMSRRQRAAACPPGVPLGFVARAQALVNGCLLGWMRFAPPPLRDLSRRPESNLTGLGARGAGSPYQCHGGGRFLADFGIGQLKPPLEYFGVGSFPADQPEVGLVELACDDIEG